MERIALTAIAFDAGTQIREAINEQVVADYAERMTEGVEFPPVVLFADGCCRTDGSVIYYLADGFHRVQAATRIGCVDITATVKAGTKKDALWFALGANKANGHRMTAGDKRHAIVLALQTWPERSGREIAAQVGCSHTYVQTWVARVRLLRPAQVATTCHLDEQSARVTGKDGKSYPASRPRAVPPLPEPTYVVETEAPRRAPVVNAPPRPPSNGMQFARIAVMKLEEIRDDDTERVQAFTHVRAWLDAHQ